MQVNAVEALWLVSCIVGIMVTAGLLIDAITERHAYIKSGANGRVKARKLVLDGTVRRDAIRLVVQTALLTVVFPSLMTPGDLMLSFATLLDTLRTVAVVAVISVPILLLVSSVFDTRDRRTLKELSESIVISERQTTDAAIMTAIEEVGGKADAAYREANTVNQKIADLDQRLVEQGDRADADRRDHVDQRLTEHSNALDAEMRRTDAHQGVQDGRITELEP